MPHIVFYKRSRELASSRDFLAILGRGPRAFPLGKISDVNPEFFSADWEKSHLNSIGNGALFRPLRLPKKIPVK